MNIALEENAHISIYFLLCRHLQITLKYFFAYTKNAKYRWANGVFGAKYAPTSA